ncbi:hypothetical protein [Serratia entomophila]|uniref:hypothetical protein n=1 Tax=Serratia entomophila TaxID=42906 RepID=UPI002179D2C1|nr:hypothetical protein [Serratia entomophila]CAI1094336.1 Uncharacterised protein [Serratia entomophila]CAI1885275.1 Uncharacterised protein [Serratia entomophila]
MGNKWMEAEKRWENLETLRTEMGELADEIIEWSEDGHYRARLIRLYDLADSVFSAKNVKRLLVALITAEQQQASGKSAEAVAQEERAENAEQELSLARDRIAELETLIAERQQRLKRASARKKERLELLEQELRIMTESNRNHVLALGRAQQRIAEMESTRE